MLTFENLAARDAYLPHPEHKKFGDSLGKSGIFAGAFVVDYTPTVRQDVSRRRRRLGWSSHMCPRGPDRWRSRAST